MSILTTWASLSINIFRLRVPTFMYDGEHLDIVSLDLVKNAVSVDRDLSHVRITELGRYLADTGQFFEGRDFGANLLGNSFFTWVVESIAMWSKMARRSRLACLDQATTAQSLARAPRD